MGRAGLVLGIVASAVSLIVGVQIIIAGDAYMPIVASRFWSVRDVEVIGFPAHAMGMVWLCGGFSILDNLLFTRIDSYSSKLVDVRNNLFGTMRGVFFVAVVGTVGAS